LNSQRSTCLCLPSSKVKSGHHHTRQYIFVFNSLKQKLHYVRFPFFPSYPRGRENWGWGACLRTIYFNNTLRFSLPFPKFSGDLDITHSPSSGSEKTEDVPKECENISSMVAFENLPEKVSEMVLTILVENISGLPSDDFKVEVNRDFAVAVVTFQKPIGELQGPLCSQASAPHTPASETSLKVWFFALESKRGL
jgi:hypothetical protein